MKNTKKIIFILMFAILTAGCAGQGKQTDGLLLSEADSDFNPDNASDGNDGSEAEDGFKSEAEGEKGSEVSGSRDSGTLIYVQVSGAVNQPGVYALPEGSRVFQAVELAGGLTKEADLRTLNQAQPLTDGEMIWVMTAEEAANREEDLPEDAGAEDDGRVNLNTATKEELMELPGIGAAKAAGIIAWREANGSFTRIEELMEIEGIKEGVFSKIEDYVKVQ